MPEVCFKVCSNDFPHCRAFSHAFDLRPQELNTFFLNLSKAWGLAAGHAWI